MTIKELNVLLKSTGYPVAFRAFKTPQTAPYIVYVTTGAKNIFADGRTYYSAPRVQVELYTTEKSLTAETAVETALSDLAWTKDEGDLPEEHLYMVTYQLTL